MHVRDVIAGAVLLAVSLVMIFFVIPEFSSGGLSDGASLSPSFMPMTTMCVVAVASLALMVRSLFAGDSAGSVSRWVPAGWRKLIAATGIFGGVVLALPFLGMFASASLLSISQMLLLNERRWYALAAMGIGMPLFIYIFFERALGVQLP